MSLPDSGISDEFHMWLGYCIANWAKVEELLFQIFHEALQCPLTQAAIVYYRSPTVATRLGLAAELTLSVLPQKPKKSGAHDNPATAEWKQLAKDIGDLLGTRGRLAHHPVTTHGIIYAIEEDSGGFAEVRDGRYAMSDLTRTEKLRAQEAEKRPLLLADLKRHRADTEVIRERLSRFRWATLPRHRVKHPQRRPDIPQT